MKEVATFRDVLFLSLCFVEFEEGTSVDREMVFQRVGFDVGISGIWKRFSIEWPPPLLFDTKVSCCNALA